MPDRDAVRLLRAFGASVRAIRLDRALSQEALAERAGLHRTYVGDIERGRRNVSLVNIDRLARALSTSPADLLVDTDRRLRP